VLVVGTVKKAELLLVESISRRISPRSKADELIEQGFIQAHQIASGG
jgi:hypothetical protein